MHAHWSPPELMDIYRARTEPPMIHTNEAGEEVIKTRRGEQSFDGMFDDLETRLAEMDAHGVTTGVLSLWGPHQWIERLPVAESVPAVQVFNNATSAVCADNPGRFVAYGSLPMTGMDAAIAELDRIMTMPGMIGAIMPANAFMRRHFARFLRRPTVTRRCCLSTGVRALAIHGRAPVPIPTISFAGWARSICSPVCLPARSP
jgi:predicted TIM-barrel fold metal-dependent hydrolase